MIDQDLDKLAKDFLHTDDGETTAIRQWILRRWEYLRELCESAENWLSVPPTTRSDHDNVAALCRKLRLVFKDAERQVRE